MDARRALLCAAAVVCLVAGVGAARSSSSATSLGLRANGRVAVLSEPGMPYFMADSAFSPEDAVDDLAACGIPAEAVSVADTVAGRLSTERYAALLTIYGNTFPRAVAPHVEAFHRAGGGLLNMGVPFCHPCVPAGPVGWMLYASPRVRRDAAVFASAPYSVRVDGLPQEGSWQGLTSTRVAARPGEVFEVGGRVRSAGPLPAGAFVYVRFFRPGGEFITQEGPAIPGNAADWTPIAGQVTAPPGAASADVCVALFRTGTVWVDDLRLRRRGAEANLLSDPGLDGEGVALYDDLGHVGEYLIVGSIGSGGYRVVEGVMGLRAVAAAGLGGDVAQAGLASRIAVTDEAGFEPGARVEGLVVARDADGDVGYTSALIHHAADGPFQGAVDAWISTTSPPRPLVDRLVCAVTARALRASGLLSEAGYGRAQTAAWRIDVPPARKVALPARGTGWRGVFPKAHRPAKTLLSISVAGLPPDDQLTLTALQGLANREQPRVYIADEWQSDLTALGYAFVPVEDPWSLLGAFGGLVRGLAVYDPALPATANVALTLCGTRGLLPVSPRQLESGALGNLPVVEALPGRFGAEAEAYAWAFDELRDECTDRVLCHEKQAEPLRSTAAETAATIADYVVQHRVFSWHLNRSWTRADREVAARILASYPVNTPIIGHFGPEPSGAPNLANEGEVVDLISRYAKFFVFLVSRNVSVHSGFPTPRLTQRHLPAPPLDPSKVYVAPYLSDGDSPTTFYQGRQRWADPARGKVPIAWSLGPAALELYPVPMRWFYEHATENDCFVAACSGAGYCYPRVYGEATTLGRDSCLDAFLALTEEQMRQADLSVCHIHHVAGLGPEELDRYAARVPSLRGILADYARVVGSYAEANSLSAGRVPTFHAVTSFPPPDSGDLSVTWSREIEAFVPGDVRPGFAHFFGCLWVATPTDMARTIERLPSNTYVPVRPDVMAELYRQAMD